VVATAREGGKAGGAVIREPGDLPAGGDVSTEPPESSRGRVDVMELRIDSRPEGGRELPVTVWPAGAPRQASVRVATGADLGR